MVQDISDPGMDGQTMNDGSQQQMQQPAHKPGVIVFGSQKKQGPSPEVMQINSQVAEVGRRIRTLEDRYSNLRRKTQVTDQNMLGTQKNLSREIKSLNMQTMELQKGLSVLEDKMKQISRELENFARSEDVRVLKRYLEFWRPLDFVTKADAEDIIRKIKGHKEENDSI